jgi:hypothetical protein
VNEDVLGCDVHVANESTHQAAIRYLTLAVKSLTLPLQSSHTRPAFRRRSPIAHIRSRHVPRPISLHASTLPGSLTSWHAYARSITARQRSTSSSVL